MAVKGYSDEIKADAVALYESTPGATYRSIAADRGINTGHSARVGALNRPRPHQHRQHPKPAPITRPIRASHKRQKRESHTRHPWGVKHTKGSPRPAEQRREA